MAGAVRRAPYGADTEGIRLRLQLQTPEEANEETLLRTIDLVQGEDFQRARRRLWSWKMTLPPNPDLRDVTAGLEALVADYNAAVRRQQATTRVTWVFLIVPALVGAGLDALTGGVTGVAASIGASVVFDRVKARFPTLGARQRGQAIIPAARSKGCWPSPVRRHPRIEFGDDPHRYLDAKKPLEECLSVRGSGRSR